MHDAATKPRVLLLSPLFLGALALLLINDWALKATFPGWITGKLSDVAGVLALSLFLAAVTRGRTVLPFALAGALFALWKLPLSRPAIAAWNELGLWPAGRAEDPTDLLALLVLPVAWLYARRFAAPLRRDWLEGTVILLSCGLFAATSRQARQSYRTDYRVRMPQMRLINALDSIGRRYIWRGQGEAGVALGVEMSAPKVCPMWDMHAELMVARADSGSAWVRLREITCHGARDLDHAAAQKVFQDSVVLPLRAWSRRAALHPGAASTMPVPGAAGPPALPQRDGPAEAMPRPRRFAPASGR